MVNKYMLLLVASVVVASLSQILLKKSAQKTYSSVIREYLNPYSTVTCFPISRSRVSNFSTMLILMEKSM